MLRKVLSNTAINSLIAVFDKNLPIRVRKYQSMIHEVGDGFDLLRSISKSKR
jgi:hypothetical protein